MSTFTTPLNVEIIGKWKFKLIDPFEYHIGQYPSEDIIKVPKGFITDLASIPRIFWPILSPIDEYAKAAVLHDWLYYTGMYPKTKTEYIFNEAMQVLNTPEWKRKAVFNAVYYFGYYKWYKCRYQYNKSLTTPK